MKRPKSIKLMSICKKYHATWIKALSCIISLFIFAQQVASQINRTIYASIEYIDTSKHPNQVFVYSAYAPLFSKQQKAEIICRNNEKRKEIFDQKLGNVAVDRSNDSIARFLITSVANINSRKIEVGDLVAINVMDTIYNPIYLTSHIIPLQIKLLNHEGSSFFTEQFLARLYKQSSPGADKWLLDTLYTDLKNLFLNDSVFLNSEKCTKKIQKGRYAGKNVQQVLESLNREDIESFLWYIVSYPYLHAGFQYKLHETFATWLVNNSPIGGYEILKEFQKVDGDSSAYVRRLQQYPELLQQKDFAINVAEAAYRTIYYSDRLAEYMFRAASLFSNVSGNLEGAGLINLMKAQKLQDARQYDAALYYCRLSQNLYEKTNNFERRIDLLFKQSYIYYSTSRYDSSIAMLKKIMPIINENADKLIDHMSPASATRKYYEYYAYTLYNGGRYAEATRYIDTALQAVDTTDIRYLANSAYLYSLLGRIYKSQELYEKSYQAFRTSNHKYFDIGDVKNAINIKNEIGVIYFYQGKYRESNEMLLSNIKAFEYFDDPDNAGYAYSQIGQNYWNLGMWDSSIDAHNKSIEYRRQANNLSGEAFSWKQLGTLYQKAGLKPKALAAYDTAAIQYRTTREKAEEASVLLEAGDVYKLDKETGKAEEYYRHAANVFASIGNTAGYASAMFELGLLKKGKDQDVAEIYMDSCRQLSKEAGLKTLEAYSMMNIASMLKIRGKINDGNQLSKEAKQIIDRVNEPHASAQYERLLGYDAEWALDLDSANRCFEKARLVFDSTDVALSLEMLIRQANNLQSMGRYDSAKEIISIVQERAKAGNYTLALGNAFETEAWLLLQQGKINQGFTLADSASKYYQLSGNYYSLASIYSLRGELYRKMYRFSDAYTWYKKSDSIYVAQNNPWARSNGMINFIVLYYYQGDYPTALEYTYKAMATRPFLLEDQYYLDFQAKLIELYYYLGNVDSSLLLIEKYLPLARQKKLTGIESGMNLMLGRILVDKKQFIQAIPHLQKNITTEVSQNDPVNYQQALSYLGLAWQGAGQPDSSAVAFAEAVRIARVFELPSFAWEALYLAGLNAYNLNEYKQAIDLFKESVALVNKQANNLYGGEEAGKAFRSHPRKADLYFKLMSALGKVGRKEEAWQYASLSQAAALSDLSGGVGAEAQNPEKKSAILEAQNRFQQLQSVGSTIQELKKDSLAKAGQITVLEKNRAIAEQEYLRYLDKLKKDFPELRTFFANQVDPQTFRKLNTHLPEDMAMMMYVVNDDELLIFWATREKIGIEIQEIPKDFYQLEDDWISALKNPNRPANAGPLVLRTKLGQMPVMVKPTIDVKDGAIRLYNLLVKPIIDDVGDKKTWCIIPNGKLSHLPFHVLGTKNNEGKFVYLTANKNIFYTNQPGEMFLPWSRKDKKNFAAFGNPDKSLASAGDEAREIAKTLNSANVYLEDSATVTKAAYSLSNMEYVHFATHGILSYPDFDSSYLVFASQPGSPVGGKITLYDIKGMNIKGCDLVTLSACETAVSAEISKGWYVSPANAFLINNVHSVVASLWEVDDKSTSMLMQRFYEHLQTMPKTDALRTAMADVSAVPEFEHPFYWAAFVLYGDWQ